ncbi:MarR family transcriptional regulator [Metabacillus indicus]|uniref:MarR family winged helix-turn-helix transcriptional regulator n=1 Tax=Metabacillus indicus TaxID=246786 RepID=UPI002A05B80C|nr:MarR family transcriptional regulator [Metabacillus indicus]MDX8290873.1 MarR family transcriptional regulator [Metabacillus indicus]
MASENSLSLEQQLCFSIYACSREMTKLYRPILQELGLTYPQYLVMLVLWEQEEISVKALGKELFLDSGTLTPLLKRLEEAGFVQRNRSKKDERKVNICLTERGRNLQTEAYRVPEYMLSASGLNQEDFERLNLEFRNLLKKLTSINTNV